MSSFELDALIVEHLADLDRAAAGIKAIEARVFAAFGDKAGAWAKKQGWISDFEYPEGGWFYWKAWVAPPQWRTAETAVDDKKFDGKFALEGATAGKDFFLLTCLCGTAVDRIGFRFGRPEFVRVRKWKQAVPRLFEFVKNTGFVLDEEPSFFLPVTIQPAALAQALREEDLEVAFKPFDAALDSLLSAEPAFYEVLQSLRSSDS